MYLRTLVDVKKQFWAASIMDPVLSYWFPKPEEVEGMMLQPSSNKNTLTNVAYYFRELSDGHPALLELNVQPPNRASCKQISTLLKWRPILSTTTSYEA